jgi:hypothetical protein
MAATDHLAHMLALSSEKDSIITLGNEGSAERRRNKGDQPSQGSTTNKRYAFYVNYRHRNEGRRIKDAIIKWIRDKEKESQFEDNLIYIPEDKWEENNNSNNNEEVKQASPEGDQDTVIINDSQEIEESDIQETPKQNFRTRNPSKSNHSSCYFNTDPEYLPYNTAQVLPHQPKSLLNSRSSPTFFKEPSSSFKQGDRSDKENSSQMFNHTSHKSEGIGNFKSEFDQSLVFESQMNASTNLNNMSTQVDFRANRPMSQELPIRMGEKQMSMMSPIMENSKTSKIVQFYESMIFKMSEEMQKLLMNQSKLSIHHRCS